MINTLLLREHNRIAGVLDGKNPDWDDERVFQTARNVMIPLFIKIVVEQYINHITPLPFSLRADPTVAWTANWNRPNWITAEFSLLYRWHSLMPDTIQWAGGRMIPIGNFTLDNGPLLSVGLDAAFSAAALQPAGELGALNTADSLLPIEMLSVNQARFNRLDTYNNYRQAFGMPPAASFGDISSNPRVVALLTELYGTADKVEFYPGLFAEDRVPDSPLPELLLRMVAADAFSQALTNPLLSEHVFNADTFTPWGFNLINSTSKLGDLLARNVPLRGPTAIEMTQAGWSYVNNR
jgi:prostaglandin-endoperoxide synthase 2